MRGGGGSNEDMKFNEGKTKILSLSAGRDDNRKPKIEERQTTVMAGHGRNVRFITKNILTADMNRKITSHWNIDCCYREKLPNLKTATQNPKVQTVR